MRRQNPLCFFPYLRPFGSDRLSVAVEIRFPVPLDPTSVASPPSQFHSRAELKDATLELEDGGQATVDELV